MANKYLNSEGDFRKPDIRIECLRCGTVVYRRPAQVAGKRGKYCSKPCYRLGDPDGLVKRFWMLVDKTPGFGPNGDCWQWTGKPDNEGYGKLYDKSLKRARLAHRISWTLHSGAIPSGLKVLHRCDNPPCTKPDHLFLGTQADNIKDMWNKGRQQDYSETARGEQQHSAKLTENDVRVIRQRRDAGESCGLIARDFQVQDEQIRRIGLRRIWKHVV